jgi:hypothetical protein
LRWAVGRVFQDGADVAFEYLTGSAFEALNGGRSEAQLRAAGFGGYPAFERSRSGDVVYRDRVIDALLRRLPPATRSDFRDFLAYYRIPDDLSLPPLGLLAATEGRLPGDGFSFVDPLDPAAEAVDLVMEITGFHNYQPLPYDLQIGAELDFAHDVGNLHDRDAVEISIDGQRIGYINRLQAPTVRHWLASRSVSAVLQRLNGRPEKPKAFAFVEVRGAKRSIAA